MGFVQLFVNRRRTPNVGDRFSSPHPYFKRSFSRSICFDVQSPIARRLSREISLTADIIIVGGGGLIGRETFVGDIDFWTNFRVPKVLWGAGHNSNSSNHLGTVVSQTTADDYRQLSRFDLVGLRDTDTAYNWVPCVSCLHPAFSATGASQRRRKSILIALNEETIQDRKNFEVILLAAKKFGQDFDVIFNHHTFRGLIPKIEAADIVVTNSFHCAYWGVILGRRVVGIGGGSKMRRMRHKIPAAAPYAWADAIAQTVVYGNALDECRQANLDFAKRVKQLQTGFR